MAKKENQAALKLRTENQTLRELITQSKAVMNEQAKALTAFRDDTVEKAKDFVQVVRGQSMSLGWINTEYDNLMKNLTTNFIRLWANCPRRRRNVRKNCEIREHLRRDRPPHSRRPTRRRHAGRIAAVHRPSAKKGTTRRSVGRGHGIAGSQTDPGVASAKADRPPTHEHALQSSRALQGRKHLPFPSTASAHSAQYRRTSGRRSPPMGPANAETPLSMVMTSHTAPRGTRRGRRRFATPPCRCLSAEPKICVFHAFGSEGFQVMCSDHLFFAACCDHF